MTWGYLNDQVSGQTLQFVARITQILENGLGKPVFDTQSLTFVREKRSNPGQNIVIQSEIS